MSCQQCRARTHNYLCKPCSDQLRAWYLELVTGPEVANGHLAHGILWHLRDLGGNGCAGEHTSAGAAGDGTPPGDPRALKVLDQLRDMLAEHAADVDGHDTICAATVPADFIGPLPLGWHRGPAGWQPAAEELAVWLAGHLRLIARHKRAGDMWRQTRTLVRRALATIDTPPPRRTVGPCLCGVRLTAPENATEAACPSCGIVHDVAELQRSVLADLVADGWGFTRSEFPVVMSMLGNPVSARTFRHWRKTGRLPVAGWRHPDGRIDDHPAGDDDEPVYRPADLTRTSRAAGA